MLGMDFLKKVITSVGSAGLAPNFPYAMDGQIASEAEFRTTGGIWSIHDAHNINFKKVSSLLLTKCSLWFLREIHLEVPPCS